MRGDATENRPSFIINAGELPQPLPLPLPLSPAQALEVFKISLSGHLMEQFRQQGFEEKSLLDWLGLGAGQRFDREPVCEFGPAAPLYPGFRERYLRRLKAAPKAIDPAVVKRREKQRAQRRARKITKGRPR